MKKVVFSILFALPVLLTSCTSKLGTIEASKVAHKKEEARDFIALQTIPEALAAKLQNLKYKIDSYQNIWIEIEDLSENTLSKLSEVILEMKQSYKNYGLYVSTSINNGSFSNDLEKLGLRFWEANSENKTLVYLYPNGRNIPKLDYAYTAAAVYLLRTNPSTGTKEILIINEPQKKISNIIGGISIRGETPEDTVVRETSEEVGINLNKDKLQLVAVCHTVRPDKRTYVEFLYLYEDFKGKPKVDGVEVSECAWIPLSKIMEEGVKVFGKPFYSVWQKLLRGEVRTKKHGEYLVPKKKAYQNFSAIPEK
jgi:ADP-ribose pyrophosphatase YjhB (NUDIX family)